MVLLTLEQVEQVEQAVDFQHFLELLDKIVEQIIILEAAELEQMKDLLEVLVV